MAKTLASLSLRWHNGRGAIGVAAPLPGMDTIIGAQRLPIDVLPGMGLDILDVIKAGVELVNNPLDALSGMIGAVLGEGGLAIMRTIGRRWLKVTADILDDLGLLLRAGWELLEQCPLIGGFLQMVSHMGENFLDSLAYELLGGRADPANPPRGNIRCWRQIPASDTVGGGRLDYQQFRALPQGTEIARQIASLIRPLLPEIWRFEDDTPPVDWHQLCSSSKDPVIRGGSGSMNWDIDDDEAELRVRPSAGLPYLKAWKYNDRRIVVEIGAIRLGSFWPCSQANSALTFEHEGDGERCYAHFQVDPLDDSGNLSRCAEKAVLRLTGLVGWGHGHAYPVAWDRITIGASGRAQLSTSRGSHAVSGVVGPAYSGSGLAFFATDFYPGQGMSGVTSDSDGYIETESEHLLNLYYAIRYYGYADVPGAKMCWGNRSPAYVTSKGYDVYSEGCGSGDAVDYFAEFPLLDVPGAEESTEGTCACGEKHEPLPCRPTTDECDTKCHPIPTLSEPSIPDKPGGVESPCSCATDELLPAPSEDVEQSGYSLCPVTLYSRRTGAAYGLAADFLKWSGVQRVVPWYTMVDVINERIGEIWASNPDITAEQLAQQVLDDIKANAGSLPSEQVDALTLQVVLDLINARSACEAAS